jgi:hypothetical protein
VEIIVNTEPLTRYLGDFEQRQVPYALSNTLNDVAKLFQYRERQHIGQQFTVRRKQWVDNSVKITEFATKRKLQTTVAIESPGGGKRSDILGKFESQTSKTPHGGGRSIAVPVDVRRSKADIITKANRPRAFNFKEMGGSHLVNIAKKTKKHVAGGILRGALKVYQGEKRTVMIRNNDGQGVILQRTGGTGHKGGLKVLYRLTKKVMITPNLNFIDQAQQATRHAGEFFAARFREAMQSGR